MARGIVYGVGVAPGDCELLTLKAVHIIREADVLAVPHAAAEESLAYKIALAAVPEATLGARRRALRCCAQDLWTRARTSKAPIGSKA